MTRVELFLKEITIRAGDALRKHFGKVKTIQYKGGSPTNLVTNVDKAVEELVKKEIQKKFPGDGILAEESPSNNSSGYRKWIIDPLDGTTNFAHGLPLFCVSIAVEQDGQVISGAVYNPILNEFFFASEGKGAKLNGKTIHVSTTDSLKRSLLATGFPYNVHDHPEYSLPFFNAFIQKAQGIRRLGSAALDLCYLAMGRFDGFFEVYLNPWDTAAGMMILQEAGGVMTDFAGGSYSIYKKQLAASNGKIQEEMLAVIREVQSRGQEVII